MAILRRLHVSSNNVVLPLLRETFAMLQTSHALPVSCRAVQGISPFEQWAGTTDEAIREKVRALKAAGAGGLMTTVSLKNYLRDEESFEVLRRGVMIAHEEGLRVWIYDEEGYPSGAAGGLVLERVPSAEAQGLIRVVEPGGAVRYDVIRLYEGTHATENFYKKRRIINILDPTAVATFLAVTHDHYARVLEPIDRYVEAFFTDEPSLISAYIPTGRDYPKTLPWHPRLPEEFRKRKGYDLLPHRESLFTDTGEMDRKVRCDFYDVIADLCAETYFGGLQRWCQEHHVASSGHLLGEETMIWQTDFDGDPFTCYRKFDIPGIDMILSDPEKILHKEYFMVPLNAGSSVRLQGKRRLMCEISDYFGQMDNKPAGLDQMRCTAGILYSLGVTDLVSFYPLTLKPESELKPQEISATAFRPYADFSARLNAVFTSGEIESRLAVLYPMLSVWSHFTPSNRSMYERHPDADVWFFDRAFIDLCRSLLRQQIDFDLVDERSLAGGRVDGKALVAGNRRYEAILLPHLDTLRLGTLEAIVRFAEAGGAVFAHPLLPRFAAEGPEKGPELDALVRRLLAAGALEGSAPGLPPLGYLVKSRVPPRCEMHPASPDVLCRVISRKEGPAYFLVNVSSQEYAGTCLFRAEGKPTLLDPASGEERPLAHTAVEGQGPQASITLRPFESAFILFR